MTPQQIVAVVLRLLALAGVLFTISQVYLLYASLEATPGLAASPFVVWGLAWLQLVVCVALWLAPGTIARMLLPAAVAAEAPVPGTAPRLAEWQALGIVCIGLWTLARAIPDSVYWITWYHLAVNNRMGLDAVPTEQLAGALSNGAELALGMGLVFGARSLAGWLAKGRTGA